MTRLFHVSDLHFGAEDRRALDWFAGEVSAHAPDAVVVTGDLTMRARSREFDAAALWLAALGRPVKVEIGNHDLPYFDPAARAFYPYRRYEALRSAIEAPLALDGVLIVPLMTTARAQWRLNWSKGHVSRARLSATVAAIAAAPPETTIFVACHHPLIHAGTKSSGRTRRGGEAVARLAQAGAHAVLSGHVHDPFDIAHPAEGRTLRMIGAGTLSERIRVSPPSYNDIRVTAGQIAVTPRVMG